MTTRRELRERRDRVVTFFTTRLTQDRVAIGVCENCIRHDGCDIKAACLTQDFAQYYPRDVLPIDETVRLAETLAILAPQ